MNKIGYYEPSAKYNPSINDYIFVGDNVTEIKSHAIPEGESAEILGFSCTTYQDHIGFLYEDIAHLKTISGKIIKTNRIDLLRKENDCNGN